MTDTSYSRSPRSNGADNNNLSLGRLFRNWLRAALRGKSEANWRDTIEELIEEGEETETPIAVQERRLLGNILRLNNMTAYDVMVPRADIVAVDIATPLPEVLEVFSAKAHSRLPVYRDSLDDVLGMVHIRDVLAQQAKGQPGSLRDVLREMLIVAPSMRVLDLLLEMRQKRQHMTLVVDEYGGIDGLITIEDLIEEIVGEIQDEHETEEPPQIVERPDGSYLADARVPIEDFEERLGPVLEDDEREDIDTLGGLVFSLAGRVPARGELLRHPSGLEFEVVDADPRRIKRLRVRRLPPPEEQAEAPEPE